MVVYVQKKGMRTVLCHGFFALSSGTFEFGHAHADDVFAIAVKGHLGFAWGVLDECRTAFSRDSFG